METVGLPRHIRMSLGSTAARILRSDSLVGVSATRPRAIGLFDADGRRGIGHQNLALQPLGIHFSGKTFRNSLHVGKTWSKDAIIVFLIVVHSYPPTVGGPKCSGIPLPDGTTRAIGRYHNLIIRFQTYDHIGGRPGCRSNCYFYCCGFHRFSRSAPRWSCSTETKNFECRHHRKILLIFAPSLEFDGGGLSGSAPRFFNEFLAQNFLVSRGSPAQSRSPGDGRGRAESRPTA